MNETVFHLLVALREGPADSSRILDRLAELAPGAAAPSLAALYRALNRAIDRDWIAADRGDAPGAGGAGRGRPPQTYRITAAGDAALIAEAERMRALADLAASDEPRPRGEA